MDSKMMKKRLKGFLCHTKNNLLQNLQKQKDNLFMFFILSWLLGEIYWYFIDEYHYSYEFGFLGVIRFISSVITGIFIIINLGLIVSFFNYLKKKLMSIKTRRLK